MTRGHLMTVRWKGYCHIHSLGIALFVIRFAIFFFFVLAIFASPVCMVMSDHYVTILNEWNDLFLLDWANGYDLLNCCLSRSRFSNSRFNISPQNMVCGRGSKVYGKIWTCRTCGDVQRTRKWKEISNPLSFRCHHQLSFFFCLFVELTMGLLFIGCKIFLSQSRSAAIAIAYLLNDSLEKWSINVTIFFRPFLWFLWVTLEVNRRSRPVDFFLLAAPSFFLTLRSFIAIQFSNRNVVNNLGFIPV